MRLTIAGGGTGGHISPAIAVGEAVRELNPGAEISYVATPRPVDRRMYADLGDAVHVLDPPRVDRGLTDMVLLPCRAVREYARARKLLRNIGTTVLFATGGYPSIFPLLAARRMGIPTAIHESNSIPGRANRMAARFADVVMTGFPSASGRFRSETILTGNPVRPSMKRYDRSVARRELGLPGNARVVLFLGGSQGARALNDLALKVPDGIHLLLQCGSRDLDRVMGLYAGDPRMKIFDFMDDPALLYSAADLAVARSGAMTVAELAWFRLPAVYVPYPFAADDHQRWNAEEVASKGGAIVMEQDSISAEALWTGVTGLFRDREALDRMGSDLAAFMPVNPAVLIARAVMELAEGRGRNG
ncbi:MAG: UDP-N-acetylglucosamine--N-acetylmuramyl-(pentapeptide) pyrophosphoryl-undecaprenol N-acetylglucosamine transferase [Candidatus Fermentibacteraceae bacterium]|nr:UDP-N-acetylglucosamine--N-acetylmuramyl-(pentapeptide) pyrophosphoryl-undecaprenol N-acetylglucosamine transferase [Candidatus Fermentibacteraceae bacterium]